MAALAKLSKPPPLEVPPAYEVVLEHLRREIQLGKYPPGEKFPPERAHAELLGVSRVTLREAIRALEGEGYVETRRGATGGVAVLDRREPPEQLRDRLRWSIDELESISDFRIANERCAAERAAKRISGADLDELEDSIRALEESETIGQFRLADSRFHLGIAQASRTLSPSGPPSAQSAPLGFADVSYRRAPARGADDPFPQGVLPANEPQRSDPRR